jgi:predicted Fe-Mo cluster-binding NifX family protein
MATRVALTVWDGRVSPVFDVFREALLVEVERGQVVSAETKAVVHDDPLLKIHQLLEGNVDTVICGAISEGLLRELAARGVRVVSFVAGDVEAVLAAFLRRKLPSPELSLPGCHGRQARRRFREARNQGRGKSGGWGWKGSWPTRRRKTCSRSEGRGSRCRRSRLCP